MMKKPLLGVTGPSGFSSHCFRMAEKYFGANFVTLPHENQENLRHWLKQCDGLVVAGGVDIHPSLYGKNVRNQQGLSKFDIQRDMRELGVVNYCLKRKKPMLCICRGHQLLSIALGLAPEFVMDLGGCDTVHQPNSRNGITASEHDVMHSVHLLGDFLEEPVRERESVHTVLGESSKQVWVNSYHHQGIFYLNMPEHYKEKGVEVLGVASAEMDKKNGSIIELMRGESWVSTQWHPEYDYENNTPSRSVLNMFKRLLEK
jgi:putative glutamine amidotransferase